MIQFGLIVLAAEAFSWSVPRGLSLDELAARYVADQGHVSVSVEMPGYRTNSADSKSETLPELGERIRKRLALAPGRFGGFATSAWPAHLVVRQNTIDHPKPAEHPSSLMGFKWEKGLLTGRTEPGAVLEVGRLSELGLSRPIHLHWFYQAVPIHLVSARAAESEVIASVAEALGADLRITQKSYLIEPNSRELRLRLAATYQEQSSNERLDRFTRAKYRVATAALKLASDDEVQELYSRPGKEMLITNGDQQMAKDIDTVLQEYFAQLSPEAKSNPSVKSAVEFYRDHIDFKAPRALIIRSVGGVLIRLRGLNPNELFDL